MEDPTQTARRGRPESSLSGGGSSRMTPTPTISASSSANNSSRDLLTPRREGGSQTSSVGNGRGGSGASLLQERLRERKVESAKAAANAMGADFTPGAERGVQSSPVRGSGRDEKKSTSSGVGSGGPGKGLGMGVKQMEEQVSTLHKQNFDLKLELYHRRQRQEALETKLEAAERQIEEQAEMQDVNEQLLAELERRDQALDEAVGVIVGLEEKVDRLLSEREMVRSVDAQLFQVPATEPEALSSSPSETTTETARNVVRMPSFLSERSEGTEALRSLYLPRDRGYSDATLPQLLEEASMDGMNSPRLSVLSKSSFVSVYGEKALDLNDEPEEPTGVETWVEAAPSAATPRRVSPDISRNKQFLSINDVLESPLQRLEKLRHTLEKHSQSQQRPLGNEKRRSREVSRRAVADKSSFDQQQMLPPTPDTISTSTLRHYQNSNEAMSFDHAAFLNKTSAFTPGITQNLHQSALSMRPRSAGETVTSRREGHGWDTETQGDNTETCSIGSTSSTFSGSAANIYKPRRVPTPDLFNFSSDPADLDWDRDAMFNEPSLPAHKPSLKGQSRRYSMAEDIRSDDTVLPTSHNFNDTYPVEQTKPSAPVLPQTGTSPRPDPPDRRSSLSAVSKRQKAPPNPSLAYPSPAPSSNNTPLFTASNTVKRPSLTTRLFRRGDQDSLTPTQASQPQQAHYQDMRAGGPQVPSHSTNSSTTNANTNQLPQRPRFGTPTMTSSSSTTTTPTAAPASRSHSYFQPHLHPNHNTQPQYSQGERATPPPIRRSRTATSSGTGYVGRERPRSAGTGSAGVGSGSGFGTRRESRASAQRENQTGKTYGVNRRGDVGYDGAFDSPGPGPSTSGSNDDAQQQGEPRRRDRRGGSVDIGAGVGGEGGAISAGAGAGGEGEKTSLMGMSGGRKWFGSLRRN